MMSELEDLKIKYADCSVEELLAVIAKLEGEVSHLRLYLFASKKERYLEDPQGMQNLFDEVESALATTLNTAESDDSESIEDNTCTKKKRGKRKRLPKNIRRVRKEIDLAEDQKTCPLHQVRMEKIGESTVEKLEIVPASSYILEEVVFKYKCPCCSEDKLEVISASKEPDLIPKSFATPSLLAYIAVSKYADALPLYRLERIFARYNIDLDRTTMARWMVKSAEACQPLINLLHDELLETRVLHCDETVVQVLKEPNRLAEQKSYMWCMARQGEHPVVLFRYFENRNKKVAASLIGAFSGVLVCDGYTVYESLQAEADFAVAGCFAHCRRKFWHAEKAAKKAGGGTAKAIASDALGFIRRLYAIEAKLKGRSPDEVLAIRQEHALPVLREFLDWLEAKRPLVLPKSPTGKAINYTLRQWKSLAYYASDGHVPIDNNFIERHIRPFVVGRKNWLFSTSTAGADASSTLYSLIETAKANGVEPFDYLKLIFKELPKAASLDDYVKLLPQHVRGHYPVASCVRPE